MNLDPPPSILRLEAVSTGPGSDAIFTCSAYSTVDVNITWFRSVGKASEYIAVGPKASIHSNGTMVIRYEVWKISILSYLKIFELLFFSFALNQY